MTASEAALSPTLPSMRADGHAVITGAGRGIGRACAVALAEAGASVTLISRTECELESTARVIDALGGSASVRVCDVTRPTDIDNVFGALASLDVVVNAAGTNIPGPFVDVAEADLDRLLTTNIKGTFLSSQAAARRFLDLDRPGSIINISSQMGHVGARHRTVYCATKHAVEGLTRAAAVELAPSQIRVNSVAPTFVSTPMTAPFFRDARFRAEVESKIPLGRIGEVSDVVGAVVFLASPAAALITGSSLVVDGGWTAW